MSHKRQDPVTRSSNAQAAHPVRVVDPSDAVTGIGMVFGVLGALAGIVAAVAVSPDFNLALLGYCLLAALSGGSAGIVTGGMIGAIIAVAKGVTRQRDIPTKSEAL